MTTSPTTSEPTSSTLLSVKVWLAPYALAVSTLYLWGYWGTFGINVLDYIGVSDIIKAAVYPVMTGLMALAVGALLGELMSPRLEPGAGANTRIGKLLNDSLPLLRTAYVVLLAVVVMFSWPNKWLVVGVLVAVPVYFQLKKSALLANEIPSDSARSITLFMLIMAVPVAFHRGQLQGTAVVEGASYQTVTSELPTKGATARLSHADKQRFIGKLGDRFAFYDPDARSVSLIESSEIKVLTLTSSALAATSVAATATHLSAGSAASGAASGGGASAGANASPPGSAGVQVPVPQPESASKASRSGAVTRPGT
jgi:hypothetical protein